MRSDEFVTGSRTRDLVIFIFLACLVVGMSFRLRVYYHIATAVVSVTSVAPDGTRRRLRTPKLFLSVHEPLSFILEQAESHIHRSMRASAGLSKAPPGTRLEWVIRYGESSMRLDRKRLIVFEADDAGRF